jgi:hypothetical protein
MAKTFEGFHKKTGDPIICEEQDIAAAKKMGFVFDGKKPEEQTDAGPDTAPKIYTEDGLMRLNNKKLIAILAEDFGAELPDDTVKKDMVTKIMLEQGLKLAHPDLKTEGGGE